ncbi:hypothetical protein N7492_007081 [Penicillium capsulatum]|uniref:Ankyrin repeat protein n=1 Tax=Penicillium capsulatum TaxID=69766 RepID=A0A9W9LLC3_9EURO|nr:hypothetical protein N7492_007081 [Penicillium capsulatum]KAJ6116915.1 hypothetical protein N7512_006640 [Penicillium capsulatum]
MNPQPGQMQQQYALAMARQKQMHAMMARQQQAAGNAPASYSGPNHQPQVPAEMNQPGLVNSPYRGLPIEQPGDVGFTAETPEYVVSFENACQRGPISTIQSIVSAEARSPAFLHHGLNVALSAGNTDAVRYLLAAGAPIVRRTPACILAAPPDQQIPLFEIFTQHGWSPNTPGDYGAVLLPKTVTSLPLLRWFLVHGANPNLGPQQSSNDPASGPNFHSCAALEAAAAHGSVEAVRMILDAGAEISYGTPLHYAAGAVPPGTKSSGGPHPTSGAAPQNMMRDAENKEFDMSRIPVMGLLVERGADVNQLGESRLVAHHPIMYAALAGAVERVRWLLEQGADPEARGAWGSAAEYVATMGSDEMKRVMEAGIRARHGLSGEAFPIRPRAHG